MSAIDQMLSINSVRSEHPRLHERAVSELSALRTERDNARDEVARLNARVTYLENDQRVQAWNEVFDLCIENGMDLTGFNGIGGVKNFIMSNIKPAALTPRNCETCQRGWVTAINQVVEYLSQYSFANTGNIIRDITAMVAPSFGGDERCVGCGPLKPEA